MKAFRVRYGNKDDEIIVVADDFAGAEFAFNSRFPDEEILSMHMMPYEVLIQEEDNDD